MPCAPLQFGIDIYCHHTPTVFDNNAIQRNVLFLGVHPVRYCTEYQNSGQERATYATGRVRSISVNKRGQGQRLQLRVSDEINRVMPAGSASADIFVKGGVGMGKDTLQIGKITNIFRKVNNAQYELIALVKSFHDNTGAFSSCTET